jgi:drug/metabolite transporter (DMT)-like permease
VRSSLTDWLVFLALGGMWGSSYLFIKIGVADLRPFTLVALRLLVGAVLLWAVMALRRQALPRDAVTYRHLVVMGFINIAIPFALITWAEQSVTSALAAILTAPVPLFAGVIAPFFIAEEPLRVNAIAGLAVGFLGVIVLTGVDVGGGSDPIGALALVAASLSYAVGAVYSRRNVHGLAPVVPATFQVTIACLISAVLALAFERPWTAHLTSQSTFAVVWLGLLGSGFAYLAVFHLLRRWGATRTTLVAYVIPVVGIALGFVVLGEPVDARVLLGTALIVGGVGLVNGRLGRRVVFARRVPPAEPVPPVAAAK